MIETTRRPSPRAPALHALGSAALALVGLAGCGDDPPSNPPPGGGNASGLTYWADIAPVVNAKCGKCHQDGGIGPFRLDSYADLKQKAPLAAVAVQQGMMPPFLVTHDGSCGEFDTEDALSAKERETLLTWLKGDMKEGTPASVAKPPRRGIEAGRDFATPVFAPVAQGGFYAEHDEYRCFLIEPGMDKDTFVAAYDILPGTAAIVHHVAVSVVDPNRMGTAGKPNGEVMSTLDSADDRAGWACLEFAGPGVAIDALPVMWAPGQQPVVFPSGVGVPLRKSDRLVVQIHYNLADPATRGSTDTTTLRLRTVDSVQRKAISVLGDPFVDSLRRPPAEMLPPGQKAAKFTWTRTLGQMGLGPVPHADLIGVMPHMHERGTKYEMRIGPGAGAEKKCVAKVDRWNFHWQRLYFYQGTPTRLTPDSELTLGCEYDTTGATTPILPGWGTRNEMCSAILLLALPGQ
jgi:hypothetical protein